MNVAKKIIGELEKCYLLAFTYDREKGYVAQELDRGCGAANVLHYTYEGKDILIAANREINEIARYELT